MNADALEVPRALCAQAKSACTARMFHWRAKKRAAAGTALLASPPVASAASAVTAWGISSAIAASASTVWIPRPAASDAGPDPPRPLTAARPLPGDVHNTVPPSAFTRAAKSAGTGPENDTMGRPVPAPARLVAAPLLTGIAGRPEGPRGG